MGFFGEIINEEKLEIQIPEGYVLKVYFISLFILSLSSLLF